MLVVPFLGPPCRVWVSYHLCHLSLEVLSAGDKLPLRCLQVGGVKHLIYFVVIEKRFGKLGPAVKVLEKLCPLLDELAQLAIALPCAVVDAID